jgi:predicted alpha/beta superfamily hydrolase
MLLQRDVSVQRSGDPYRLLLYVPREEPPRQGWPLLCLLDGNAVFGTAVDALRAQTIDPTGTHVGPGVIAAIGYPIEDAYDFLRRSWDLSPPPGRLYPPFKAGGPPVRTGGAEAFLDGIEGEILPQLHAEFAIDAGRRALFGHSFGGLFALYALFTRTGLFRQYIAASPSIAWEDFVLAPTEAAFLASPPDGRPVGVHLSAGEYEGDALAPFRVGRADSAERLARQKRERTLGHARDLADRLNASGRPGLKATFEAFAGENHQSVLSVAVNRAVQAAFSLDCGYARPAASAPE